MVDKKALKILFDTYWSSYRWKRSPHASPTDLAYATSAGVMFPPRTLAHDDTVTWAIKARSATDNERITCAFLASLSSRRLELRSALGSYAVLLHLRKHAWKHLKGFVGSACAICDEAKGRTRHDLSELSFERFKWGGVRHLSLAYAAFDLDCLAAADVPTVTAEDLALLRDIIDATTSLPARARLADLSKAHGKVLKSNPNERSTLIQILGYCGILQPTDVPTFWRKFVPRTDRGEKSEGDWSYPVCWWRGSDGINEAALRFWFPGLRYKRRASVSVP